MFERFSAFFQKLLIFPFFSNENCLSLVAIAISKALQPKIITKRQWPKAKTSTFSPSYGPPLSTSGAL
jgi:hypothetical protein